jgi:hypothetical protein
MRIILPKQTWRSEDEKRSLGSAGSKTVGVNQSPAMGSLADLDPLIVYGRQRKTQFVVLDFQKLRGHGYALADFGRRHMPHVHMNTHRLFVFVQVRRYKRTQVYSMRPIIAGVENTSETSCFARISSVVR